MDVNSAVNAKSALDGQNLYVGACTLRVQYSQLPQLNVKYNNDKSRDFLDPNLPQGPPGGQPPQPPQAGYPPAYGAYPGYAHQGYGDPSAMYHMGGVRTSPVCATASPVGPSHPVARASRACTASAAPS